MSTNEKLVVGIVGIGAFAQAITHYDTPLRGIALRQGMVESDPSVPVVIVDCALAEGTAPVLAALAQGKTVICPFPAAGDAAGLEAVERALARGGALIVRHELAEFAVCRDALAALRSGTLGKLHSLYLAARLPRLAAVESVLDEKGWPVIDLVLAIAGSAPSRLHATGGRLFDEAGLDDTVVVMLRFPQDLVVTIELSRCLPATLAKAGDVEMEVEVIGSEGALRFEPAGASNRVYADTAAAVRRWTDERPLPLLAEILEIVQHKRAVDPELFAQHRAVRVMEAIRASLRSGKAIDLSPLSS